MSRWMSNFEAHGLHASLARVVAAAEQLTAPDPDFIANVEEIGRLRKVVSYLNKAVDSLDPELLPLNFWDQIRDQMAACADQLSAYISNRNLAHLQEANKFLDAILLIIRPHLIAKGKLGPALQTAAKAYAAALVEGANSIGGIVRADVAEIGESRNRASEILASVSLMLGEIERKYKELFVDSSDSESMLTILARHYDEIGAYHRRLTAGTGDAPSIKEEVAAAREVAKAGSDAVEALRSGVAQTVSELTAFETRILGTPAEDGKRKGGVKEELEARLKALTDVEEQQRKRYAALGEKIESLLPGATSAGLASAYRQMKDSFSKPIRNANYLFYTSIFTLVVLSLVVSIEEVGFWFVKFSTLTDWTSIGRSIAHKLPFYAPLVWLAYYASKRRSEFQRLEQEYAHKEALAKSYDSYRQQISDLGGADDTLMRDLLSKAVDAIAFNASSSLDGKHGDKIPLQEAVEKAVLVAIREAGKVGVRGSPT